MKKLMILMIIDWVEGKKMSYDEKCWKMDNLK